MLSEGEAYRITRDRGELTLIECLDSRKPFDGYRTMAARQVADREV